MSALKEDKYTFEEDLIVKGLNKPEFKQTPEGMVRTNPELELVKLFPKGTTVDAQYVSGRGGATISFKQDGGILPDGGEHEGEVTYTLFYSDPNFKEMLPKSLGAMPIIEPPTEKTTDAPAMRKATMSNEAKIGLVVLGGVALGFGISKMFKVNKVAAMVVTPLVLVGGLMAYDQHVWNKAIGGK